MHFKYLRILFVSYTSVKPPPPKKKRPKCALQRWSLHWTDAVSSLILVRLFKEQALTVSI